MTRQPCSGHSYPEYSELVRTVIVRTATGATERLHDTNDCDLHGGPIVLLKGDEARWMPQMEET